MPDLHLLFTRYRMYMFYILALFVLLWGFTPYRTIFAGLILGTATSFINMWLLYKRTLKLSDAVKSGKTAYSIGSFSRFAYAALAALIAIKFPNYFDIAFTLLGLATSYLVMALDSIIMFIFKRKRKGR